MKDLDWNNLGFSYIKTDYRFIAHWKDGKWDEGGLITDSNVVLNECAGVFQYAQTIFEGLKAYYTKDGRIVCFRPDLNAIRLDESAERLVMPKLPEGRFIEAVKEVVKANKVNYMAIPPLELGEELSCTAKIRYGHKGSPCVIKRTGEDEITCTFEEPQHAITPGQAVVFYEDECVVGGGTIL